ncbi:Hypothetical predicted protein [Olea europaea subsp. europaea]|uniref:Uncharacterized protein n=1 Tax=Olea europaea subsp. europaea TaxID=158383 RepID=A0A8S0UR10_OLEEU|nr:Hypothetical predicted protein [Olea europaea subsp. europaea]
MALLMPSGISSLSCHRREIPAEIYPRNRNFRVCVCSTVRDLEEVATEVLKSRSNCYDELGWLYGKFSAPVKPTGMALFTAKNVVDEEERKQNYYVNTGYAIRTLREEFPELFYRELSFDIYRDDIVFKDPLNCFVGIENYKSIFWALRFHGRIFFRAVSVDIVSVWQPVENMIMVRWSVHGILRVPWESRGRFDGTSEYKLDKNGKIYEHRVHNIALNGPQKFQGLSVEQLIQSIGCPSTPKPTYFEFSSSSTRNIVPSQNLSGIKHYLGSLLINSLKPEAE